MLTRTALWIALLTAPSAGEDPASIAPLLGEPGVRWSFGPLAFEAEPVVAGAFVLASGREPSGRRALVVLDGASGRVLSRTLFAASLPLALAAEDEHVAVRTNPQRVDVFRLRGARLLAERSVVHATSISAPRLVDGQLTLREGDELVRYALGEREPLWRLRVPGAFHGAPCVLGASVLAGWYEPDGTAHLAWIDGASGALRGDAKLGQSSAGRAPEERDGERDGLEIHELTDTVFVHCASGLRAAGGATFPWTRVTFDGKSLSALGRLHDLLAPPIESERGWLAPERTRDGARWILCEGEPGNERVIELASPAHHAWLSTATTPPSQAGDVLYLGPAAVDARTLEVLWKRPRTPDFRPVPVPGGLLVVERDRLHCLGAPPEADPEGERALELARQAERTLGDELGQIAWRAARAGDGELAGRLALEAEGLGANERTLALVRGEAERLKSAPARTRPAIQALLAEEAAARAGRLTALAGAARRASAPAGQRALLGELIALAPEHPEGLAQLARLVPAGARIAPGESRAWLEFLSLSAANPIALVAEPEEGRAPGPESRWLSEERAAWRQDLVGYQSARLCVLTAGGAPDAVARTLRTGELVCDVLEGLFGGSPTTAGRLELLLYPTREEYLAHSGSDLGGFETVLGFTAGHFDLSARASRFYLPKGDVSGAHLASVATHELVHHWLATRSRFGAPRSAQDRPGFWIVEAFATWAEELRLEPARGTWSSAPARAASVDTAVNSGARDLQPWDEFLALSFDGYCKLETHPTCTLTLDWQLGIKAPRSPLQLFYAQGATLAHWLYEAEGGRNRPLLFRAVEQYYRGEALDLPAALGTTPAALGESVLAWARGLHD
jgi:hypothetical protein